jgi:flagella basal body P-ring formation protein FlgA
MFRLLSAAIAIVSLIAIGTTTTQAEEFPLLRADIEVEGEFVLLGDLFFNAGAAAQTAVFRAPEPGSSGVVSASRLGRAARNHGLIWDNPERAQNVTITRAGIEITRDEIADILRDTIIAEFGGQSATSNYTIEIRSGDDQLFVAADEDPTAELAQLRYNERSGRFSAVIAAPAGSSNARRYTFTGRAVEVRSMAILVRPVDRGQIISASDVEQRDMPARSANADTVFDAPSIVGTAARRALRPDQILRRRDFEQPRIVQRNTVIMVSYQAPGLVVTVRARALDEGAMGDVVRVLNLQSNRLIEGTVVGTNLVTATISSAHVVAAAN